MKLERSTGTIVRLKVIVLLVAVLLPATIASVDASVVFSQDPVNHALSRISDWSNANQKADDFILTTDQITITKICWWGSYGTDPDPAVDNFVFKFFLEDPGNSDNPYIWCFNNGTRYPRNYMAADFSRTATDMVSDPSSVHDGGTVYEYSAILDRPIKLEANKRYWLAITNSTPTYAYPIQPNSKWGWLGSSPGSHWYRMGHCPKCANDWVVNSGGNMAFKLETFPCVGLSNKAASDPIILHASTKYMFTVWGKARITGENTLELDDGSGSPITVEAPGFSGIVDGDCVKATGLLKYSQDGSILEADPSDVIKLNNP